MQKTEETKESEPVALPMVAEPEYQYGAEAFEAYMKIQGDRVQNVKGVDNMVKRAEKSR